MKYLKNERSNHSNEEVELLLKQMEKGNEVSVEISRIKTILERGQYEAMELEKAIDSLQKPKSKLICDLAEKLIKELSNMKDGWHESTHQFEGSEVSLDALVDEEWGLPCPPLDEEAFLMAPTSTTDLSKFFDGIDDNGNVRDTRRLTENLKQQTKQPRGKGKEMGTLKKVLLQQSEPSHINSSPVGYKKLSSGRKVSGEAKNVLSKQVMGGPEVLHSNEDSLHMKFECTKRKIHEAYNHVENAKKKRWIQMIDFRNLPKEGNCHRHHHLRSKKFTQLVAYNHH